MSEAVSISDGAYILVADGTGGRLFSASADGSGLSLTEVNALEPENLQDEGPSGSRPPEQTDNQTDEATFAKQVAQALYSMAHAGKYDELVVIADPQTLGQLRSIFHQEVQDRIVCELGKTLTNFSAHELEQHLSGS